MENVDVWGVSLEMIVRKNHNKNNAAEMESKIVENANVLMDGKEKIVKKKFDVTAEDFSRTEDAYVISNGKTQNVKQKRNNVNFLKEKKLIWPVTKLVNVPRIIASVTEDSKETTVKKLIGLSCLNV